MEQELDAQPQRRTVLGDLSAGMYWYICYWVVAICGPITRSPWRQPDQDPWCEGMWEALKLPPGLPDPDVDLRYEAGGWCRGTWYQIHQMHTVDIRWQCNVPWYRRFNSWFWLGDNKSITNQEREDFPKQSKAWSILVVQTLLTRTSRTHLTPPWLEYMILIIFGWNDANLPWLHPSNCCNCLEVEELGETQNGQNGQNGTAHDEPWTSEGRGRCAQRCPGVCVRWVTSFILTREIYTCIYHHIPAFLRFLDPSGAVA